MFKPSYNRFGDACDAIRQGAEATNIFEDKAYPYAILVGHLQALIDITCTEEQIQFICERLEYYGDNIKKVNDLKEAA